MIHESSSALWVLAVHINVSGIFCMTLSRNQHLCGPVHAFPACFLRAQSCVLKHARRSCVISCTICRARKQHAQQQHNPFTSSSNHTTSIMEALESADPVAPWETSTTKYCLPSLLWVHFIGSVLLPQPQKSAHRKKTPSTPSTPTSTPSTRVPSKAAPPTAS